MKELSMKLWIKMMEPLKNERGAQSLEWLGLAALLILVLGIVSSAVSKEGESIGKLINSIITKIAGMVGE